MPTHKCPIPHCDCLISQHMLMCRLHWQLVPQDLRRRVYSGWNEGRVRTGYLQARREAIRSVNFKLGGRDEA